MLLSLKDTTPCSVARAFFDSMYINFMPKFLYFSVHQADTTEPELLEEAKQEKSDDLAEKQASSLQGPSPITQVTSVIPKFLESLFHVIQFYHLCAKGKIPHVHYYLVTTDKIEKWFTSINLASKFNAPLNLKRPKPASDNSSDSDDCV
jgi:hypothetical protein